jgi:N-acetylmuramoyl-L-alanine amidase
MMLKNGLNLIRNYSINFDTPERNKKDINFVIIHYTGMKSETAAIKRLCNSKSKVSSHYFIKKNGEILNLIPDNYIAWHAGKSRWKKKNFLNKNSIGIEIQNPGHSYNYPNFSEKQIVALKKLLRFLMKKHNVLKKNVLGHSDIAPERKKDPGEKFPWHRLSKEGFCIWHKLKKKNLEKFRKFSLSNFDKKIFMNNLNKIGYNCDKGYSNDIKQRLLTLAFQRRFRQELVDGKIDKECLLISKNLI